MREGRREFKGRNRTHLAIDFKRRSVSCKEGEGTRSLCEEKACLSLTFGTPVEVLKRGTGLGGGEGLEEVMELEGLSRGFPEDRTRPTGRSDAGEWGIGNGAVGMGGKAGDGLEGGGGAGSEGSEGIVEGPRGIIKD